MPDTPILFCTGVLAVLISQACRDTRYSDQSTAVESSEKREEAMEEHLEPSR